MAAPAISGSGREDPAGEDPEAKLSEPRSYQRFFAELKRRHVFRVAAVYGATAFVVMQVADLLQEGLRLPESFLTVVTVLALLGFPIAVAMAWVYERTAGGVVHTEPPADGELEEIVAAPPAKRWPAGLAGAAGTALLLVGAWWTLGRPAAPVGADDAEGYESIAVLPFVNMSGVGEDEYFSEGLSEELLNVLARIDGLKVAARTSSFAFKNSDADIREIGQTLGVETVLEGSVRRGADGLRVTAQLIDVDDGFHVWSETYDRPADDVLRLQDEIAESVAEALQPRLRGEILGTQVGGGTSDVQAHDLYLRARSRLNARQSAQDLQAAIEDFRRAVELDPDYARALAGQAVATVLLNAYAAVPCSNLAGNVNRLSDRALALDSTVAEAYAARSFVARCEHRWADEESYLLKAVAVDPSYATAHQWLGEHYDTRARYPEAEAALNRALGLNPASRALAMSLHDHYRHLGEWDRSLAELARARRLSEDLAGQSANGDTRFLETFVHLERGDFASARTSLAAWADWIGFDAAEAKLVIDGTAEPSKREAALAVMADWEREGKLAPRHLAIFFGLLGDPDAAMRNLELAEAAGDPFMASNMVGGSHAPLNSDPRFLAMWERMDLPARD